MAAALQYLKEHQLFEYDDLAAKTDAATEQFHTLAGDIQQTEAELSRVSLLTCSGRGCAICMICLFGIS